MKWFTIFRAINEANKIQAYRSMTTNTVIARKFNGSDVDPSYPIWTNENKELYKKYACILNDKVTCLGRIESNRYYSVNQIVEKMFHFDLH